ncbi:MAG: fructokinase [Gammaproteobacteria bacterium]|nr:fructokinase [Gammaproteobacteria bacterium]
MRIGVDVGGSKIEAIVIRNDGSVAEKIRVDTPAESYSATVEMICNVIKRLQMAVPLSVGIGTPGAISMPSQLMKNSNSVCLNNRPFKKDIEKTLGYEIRLENDANCFTLSEAHYGAAKDSKNVFGVIIGTGCGGGVVIDKKLVTGPNSIAGEWGHNPIPISARELIKADRACYCGKTNCNETVLSGRGLQQTFNELTGQKKSAKLISASAINGDTAAIKCIEIYADQLARCLSTIINILDPHIIVLGGGLSNIELLYGLVPNYLNGNVFTDVIHTKILAPTFGDASGALGAACLWDIP